MPCRLPNTLSLIIWYMNREFLLSTEGRKFMHAHETDDLRALLLHREKYRDIPLTDLVEQIQARRKAKAKLPVWYKEDSVLFPSPLAVEQASSEQTAKFKAEQIVGGKRGLDLTGGLGIDSYYLSKKFDAWEYVEDNAHVAELAEHNFKALNVGNINIHNVTAEEYLTTTKQAFDLVFIDPDRRPQSKKVAGFKDSRPDLLSLLSQIRKISSKLLIKASPMLDITAAIQDLGSVAQVMVVALNNDVKELLFLVDFAAHQTTSVRCVNLTGAKESSFEFSLNAERQEKCKTGTLGYYLYVPNNAVMKAGAFNSIGVAFNLSKLHKNTHLYTSDKLIVDFPGRTFEVKALHSYKKKELASSLTEQRANISTRNFIDTAQQMKKKLAIKDGGNTYLFGFRDDKGRNRVAVCNRVAEEI